jgi:hypothetical protein
MGFKTNFLLRIHFLIRVEYTWALQGNGHKMPSFCELTMGEQQ